MTTVKNQIVNLDGYRAHPLNYNGHSDAQISKLQASLSKFGQIRSIVVWREYIIAGHGLTEAAKRLGWKSLRADVLDSEISESVALAYLVADNELARQSDPDQAALAAILDQVKQADAELVAAAGFSEQELSELLKSLEPASEPVDAEAQTDKAEELQAVWNVQAGDIFQIGDHRLICGDCREPETWQRLMGGKKANGVFTSPPYAMQRKDQYGGVPTAEYVDWWEAVQANVKENLATDGSFFVNIKAHAQEQQRSLYVFDLVCSMVRRWGWLFVDEYCWLRNAIPQQVINRFKNNFEPVYWFASGEKFKFRPESVRHFSDSVPVPLGPGSGDTNAAKRQGTGMGAVEHTYCEPGLAYPSNVLDFAKGGAGVVGHAAAFPVALPDFFIRAYSDPGDVWVDPFLGSGTTMIAAHNNKRIGYGSERLEKYCAVILQRMADATGITGVRVEA